MIALGSYDSDMESGALDDYKLRVAKLTGVSGEAYASPLRNQLRDEGSWADFKPFKPGDAAAEMTVLEVQQFLKRAGFFPHGKLDRICGYRTKAAIRLFQEYVRTVDAKPEIGGPDGLFGAISVGLARQWGSSRTADWTAFSPEKPSPVYATWMTLLQTFKARCQADPGPTLKKVEAKLGSLRACDTLKVADWDFSPDRIHLVGIRRRKDVTPGDGPQVLDDVFVLLIRGIAFVFYGSTEPGEKVASQYPFLTPGQHLYRFGWHNIGPKRFPDVYRALKPAGKGVLVLRSPHRVPTDADLSGEIDGPNDTIDIHWGGKGLSNNASWSAGCQVIAGQSYINHNDRVIDCKPFAAARYADLGTKVAGVVQTKGAYSVIEDLVIALSGPDPADSIIRYTMVLEEDLALHPDLGPDASSRLLSRLKTA
jgi:peptidoglycan hydrolase-like protein with peptidoglycan-binding domain